MGQAQISKDAFFLKNADAKHGKYTRTMVWTYRALVKEALVHAENRLGRSAYIIEVAHSWNKISNKPYFTVTLVAFALYDLY